MFLENVFPLFYVLSCHRLLKGVIILHVVLGGAYNGKANWVRRVYNIDKAVEWISAYENDDFPEEILSSSSFLVIEGIEKWLYTKVTMDEWDRNDGIEIIANWQAWVDQKQGRQLIIIGIDISKGIVPVEAKQRKWRDMTGWFYQDLVSSCERFDLIWYGINQQLK